MKSFDFFLGHYPKAGNWLEAIQQLEARQMEDHFAEVIIERGLGVYQMDAVGGVELLKQGVKAQVSGTYIYRTVLHFQADQLHGECSCPYEAACKHLVALVLHINETITAADLQQEEELEQQFIAYLHELDREDLIALARRYIPREYKKQIYFQNLSPEQSHSELDALWAKTITLEEEELENIDYFDDQLALRLDRLRPFWAIEPERVILMLEELLFAIEAAVEADHLYHHYYDAYFNGMQLSDYLAELCCSQPVAQAREFILRLLDFEQELNYQNGYGYSFPASLVNAYHKSSASVQQWLRTIILEPDIFQQLGDWRIRLLEIVSDQLSKEKELALLELMAGNDLSLTLRLAQLLVNDAQPLAAIEWLDQFYEAILSEDLVPTTFDYSQLNYFELRLPLAVAYPRKDKPAIKLATAYLQKYPKAKTLQFCLAQLPDARERLEQVLKKISLRNYFDFLEQEGRLAAAVEMAKQQGGSWAKYLLPSFYRRHADQYPAAARAACYAEIDELLPHADRRNYEQIVDLLRELQAIEDAATFQVLLEQLRTEYKRRPTMMRMLEEAGW
ncbi:MAG: SWIM zinc finger family protein [Bacteroidota bacterium]